MSYLSLANKLRTSLRAAGQGGRARAAIAAEGARRAGQRAAASTLTEDQWRQKNLLQQGWEIGRPTLGDAAVNGLFSALFAGTAMTQGADLGQAAGIGAADSAVQLLLDAGIGTGAGVFGARRFRGLPSHEIREKSSNMANTGKMIGGAATFFIPNVPYENFLEDQQRKAQLLADPSAQIQSELDRRNLDTVQRQLPNAASDPELDYLRALMSGYSQPYGYA